MNEDISWLQKFIASNRGKWVSLPQEKELLALKWGLRNHNGKWKIPYDVLNKIELQDRLGEQFYIEVFSEIPSTHMHGYYHPRPKPYMLFISEFQSKGIGRKYDPWLSKYGDNVLMTFTIPFIEHHNSALKAATILSSKLKEWLPQKNIRVKPPNDVLVNEKKCLGLMIQEPQKAQECLMISLGLNVNMVDSGPLDQPWTSLYLETSQVWNRNKVASDLIKTLMDGFDL